MKFDRMGRRVELIETITDPVESAVTTNKYQRFVYDGYLCIQRLNGENNAVTDLFEWDPTERVATRPLYWQHRTSSDNYSLFYTHDGNKNVSEVVFYQRARGIAAHYEYVPFGAVTVASRTTSVRAYDFCEYNPFRFSSEYVDLTLDSVCFIFRHLNRLDGRWSSRDPGEESFSRNLYRFLNNTPLAAKDWLTQKNCNVKCSDCSSGYTVERTVTDGAGAGLSWDLPIPGLPSALKVPLSVSYSMAGGEYYFYDSCTKAEKYDKCHSFSLSGSVGAKLGVGRFIEYSISGTISYFWTDCGGESSSITIALTVEQCYWGQCWSIETPPIYGKEW